MAACASCGTSNGTAARFCNGCGSPLGASAAAQPLVERKVVTALFCDLVGSTELATASDPEDVDRLLRAYHALAKRRIETYGGTVEKFIGDAVVGVFGVPVAHEDDAERAVRAGLRIVDEIAASDLGIRVRIGVMTGETLVRGDLDPAAGEGLATGDTLNVAARLQNHAPIDGVLVGEPTYRACAASFSWDDAGPVALKGRTEPLHAWIAQSPIARATGELIPERTPFLGREFELETLVRLFERARSTPALEVITVVADPGMGKSRLMREFARAVDGLPHVVTWRSGRCLPYGDAMGFAALSEIVMAHAGILATDDEATAAAKLDAVLDEPDPGLRAWLRANVGSLLGLDRAGDAGGQEEHFAAWRRFLESIARAGPLVMVVEDLHWADPAFVEFLGELATKSAGLPLLLLVTARPEIEQQHPDWLARSRRSTVVSLAGLPEEAMRALTAATLPDADATLVAEVLERASGSPLYAEQLAAMVREQGPGSERATGSETAIPASIQALLAARIDALPPETRSLLRDAAVIGRTFWTEAVASMGDRELRDAEARVTDLVRRELVRPVTPSSMAGQAELSIWHALVRDVAYASLPRGVRADRHARFARWLEATAPARGEELAHHYSNAYELAQAARDDSLADAVREPAWRNLLVAARRATATDAALADGLFGRALAIMPATAPERPKALWDASDIKSSLGRPADGIAQMEEAVAVARALGDPVGAAAALQGLSWSMSRVADARWMPLAREAYELLASADPGPELVRATHWMGYVAAAAGDIAGQVAWENRAAALANELGIELTASIQNARGTARCVSGDAGGFEDIRMARKRHVAAGESWLAANSFNSEGVALLLFEGPGRATELYEAGIAWAQPRGVRDQVFSNSGSLCVTRYHMGRLDEAFAIASTIDHEARDFGMAELLVLPTSVRVRVSAHRDARTIDRETLAWLETELWGTEDPEWIIWALGSAALGHLALGDVAEARRLLGRVADMPQKKADTAWATTVTTLVRNALEVGDRELAHRLREGFSPVLPVGRVAAAAADAVLAEGDGDLEAATAGHEAAVVGWRAFGFMLEEAYALAGLGRCLITGGEVTAGVERLREARATWEGMGAPRRVAEIDAVLASVSTAAP